METSPSEADSARNWDKNASVGDQIISIVLQTLHCFESHITPLDIVIAILTSKDKYEQVKHAMLKPPVISKLFETLASCDTSKEFLRYNLALHAVLNRVDSETRTIVSRLGEEGFRHPILLGHAEIRSENTVAPILKAIVNQESRIDASHADDGYDFSPDWMGYLDASSSASDPTEHQEVENGDAVETGNLASHEGPSGLLEEHMKRLIGADDLQQAALEDETSPINSVGSSTAVAQTPSSSTTMPNENRGGMVEPKPDKAKNRSKPRTKRKIDEVDTETAGQFIDPNDVLPVPLYTSLAESLCFNDRLPPLPEPPIFASPLLPDPGLLQIDPSLVPRKYIKRKVPKSKPFVEEEKSVESYTDIFTEATAAILDEDSCEYKCDMCPKRFKTFRSLADHKNVHTGAKPYKCSANGCGKKYGNYRAFKNHVRSHKPDTDKDDYVVTRSSAATAAGSASSSSRLRKAKPQPANPGPVTTNAEKTEAASGDEEESERTRGAPRTSPRKAHKISTSKSASSVPSHPRSRKVHPKPADTDRPTTGGADNNIGAGRSEREAASGDEEVSIGTQNPAGFSADGRYKAKSKTSSTLSPSHSEIVPSKVMDPGASTTEGGSEPRSDDDIQRVVHYLEVYGGALSPFCCETEFAMLTDCSFDPHHDLRALPNLTDTSNPVAESESRQLLHEFPIQTDTSPFGRKVVLELPLSAKSLESIS
ncbi:hypothetical protein ACEPAF_7105 [Sanghuangporus sanghuang]